MLQRVGQQRRQALGHRVLGGQQPQRVLQAAQQRLAGRCGRLGQCQQAGTQRPQVAAEVAAVNGRHVGRPQRLQRLRVVPVEPVAAVAFEPIHRVQRRRGAGDQRRGGGVAEVVRGQRGQQRQADVGRRGAVRDALDRRLLHVVGRQVVVGRADKGLEERPVPPRQRAQRQRLFGVDAGLAARQRLVQPPRHRRRGQPRQQHRQRRPQRVRTPQRERGFGQQRERRRDRHAPQRLHEVRRRAGRPVARGLGAGLPFEQVALRHVHAPQRAQRGVEAVRGLVRQHRECERRLGELAPRRRQRGRAVRDPVERFDAAQQLGDQRDRQRCEQHRQRGRGPQRRHGQQQPAEQQQRKQRDRHQAAPQVVEDLQPRQRRQWVGRRVGQRRAGRRGPKPRQRPARDLPVAAHPAVASLGIDVVAQWCFLDELDVADQPAAGIGPFEQVVAEHAVVGQAAGEHVLEGVDVVDALADERAFAEAVLVDVADGAGVGVDARVAAAQAAVARGAGDGQAAGDARLQDAVPADDPRRRGGAADARPVQRVGHGRYQQACGAPRQLRVGVQRDDVAHPGQRGHLPGGGHEAAVAAAAQQRVQVAELAALALGAHPHPLARVPAARPVQQEEAVAAAGLAIVAIASVERLDACLRMRHQRPIAGLVLGVGVEEVGQQREVQLRVAVGEEAHLQVVDQVVDAGRAAEHRRHRDEGAAVGRQAVGEVHARQRGRPHQQRDEPVGQRHGELAGPQRQQRGGRAGEPRPGTPRHQPRAEALRAPPQRQQRQHQRQHDDAAGEPGQRPSRHAPAQAQPGRRLPGDALQQRVAAAADQVVADVRQRCAVRRLRARGLRQRHRRGSHAVLRQRRVPRDALDRLAVLVTRREVHRGIDAGRVAAQRLLDDRQPLDEVAPVHRAEQAQAADAVADRHLGGRLALRLQLHELLGRLVALGQPLLDPRQRQRQRGAQAVQPARQLGDERRSQRWLRARHVGDDEDQVLRRVFGGLGHAFGPLAGELALGQAARDTGRHAAQVLDQREPQHDRNRPQLAQLQRLHRLVGGDEARQRAAADAAVAMRHRQQGEVVDARHDGLVGPRDARQLAAVAGWQVALGGAHLLLDEVEVVEQPFARRRDAPLAFGAAREQGADLDQRLLVAGQPAQQPVRAARRAGAVAGGDAGAVLLHLLGGEQPGAQRCVVGFGPRPGEPAGRRPHPGARRGRRAV
jgi:hypothetical protein